MFVTGDGYRGIWLGLGRQPSKECEADSPSKWKEVESYLQRRHQEIKNPPRARRGGVLRQREMDARVGGRDLVGWECPRGSQG